LTRLTRMTRMTRLTFVGRASSFFLSILLAVRVCSKYSTHTHNGLEQPPPARLSIYHRVQASTTLFFAKEQTVRISTTASTASTTTTTSTSAMSAPASASAPAPTVPQTEPAAANQVPNSGGGFSFALDDMKRVYRFLILGTEGGTYYTSEKTLTLENAACVMRLLEAGRGPEVVEAVKAVSVGGRAAKQKPTLFALAMCARLGDDATRRAAYGCVQEVLRIPTHLFGFVGLAETIAKGTGWGRLPRKAIQAWYNDKDPQKLAVAVTKYQNREGWSHTDVLRLCHAKPPTKAHDAVYRYVTKGLDAAKTLLEGAADEDAAALARLFDFLGAVEEAKTLDLKKVPEGEVDPAEGGAKAEAKEAGAEKAAAQMDVGEDKKEAAPAPAAAAPTAAEVAAANAAAESRMCELIAKHGLVREHVPTPLLNSVKVWAALLEDMPMTAMLRNLAKMTSIGLLAPLSDCAMSVAAKLRNPAALRAARVHPFSILLALKTYEQGRGEKGSLTWTPVPQVVDALDEAYYMAFKNVEPTNKRFVLGIDVSGSMTGGSVVGCGCITPREGAAAMAMLTANTEPNYVMMAFSRGFVPLPITAGMRLPDVCRAMSGMPFDSTDCARPVLWALENKVKADVFVIYTDNDTNCGRMHPFEALKKYRREMGIPAKMIVVGMTSTGFSIADPSDAGMMDMVGFDADAPQIISDFVTDKL
jgi:60 kDa SS-A/Ro ribonucleoprotein